MLISRTVLETIGLLPECYTPCYCEDADYSLKVQKAGFQLVYVPGAAAFHRVSSSLGREERSPQVIYWFNRNRGYAMRRNYSGWRRAAGIGYLAVSKPARALVEVLRGRPKSGAAFIRGTTATSSIQFHLSDYQCTPGENISVKLLFLMSTMASLRGQPWPL